MPCAGPMLDTYTPGSCDSSHKGCEVSAARRQRRGQSTAGEMDATHTSCGRIELGRAAASSA
eukprot:192779-Pleurochrysis_carterae.AAC.3